MMHLESLLAKYADCNLECDGLTRILHTVLHQNDMAHTVMMGEISLNDGTNVYPHFWIELPDNYIIDYRARMWMGEEAAHGIFTRGAGPVTYEGVEVKLSVLTKPVFDYLIGGHI